MIFNCTACGGQFHEIDQTYTEWRFGQCPWCGYDLIFPTPADEEIECAQEKSNR